MKKLLFVIAISTAVSTVFAQTPFTGTYTFGQGGLTNVSSYPFNGTPIPNLTVGDYLKVGITSASATTNFRGSAWALDPVVGTLTGTVDLGKYLEFSLTAAAGYTLDMTSFDFGVGRSGTGPRQWQWRSSVDSFASIISTYTTVNAGLTQSGGVLTNPDANSGWTGNILDLSGAAFKGLNTVTFRLYGYNSEAGSGTGGLQGNFTFSGALNAPVGTTYVWSGGSGTWANGQQGGFDASFADSGIAIAQFGTAGGTVTVDASGVETGQMQFDVTGFEVTGGPVTNALGTITVTNDSVATINSDLAGTSGLSKSGGGTLVLSGSKTYSGAVTIGEGTLEIAEDGALGDAANDVALGAALRTTASIALGAGRDLSGTGTLDIADGTTLTVNGTTALGGLIVANTGTLDLQGTARSLGSITLNAAGTIDAVGAINATGLTAPGVTSGTATINPDIVFTSGDKLLNVAAGGTVDLNGALSNGGTNGRIIKTGAGTLILNANSMGGLRVGSNAVTSVNGGTVILNSSTIGTEAQAIQLNSGTLSAASNLVFTNGIAIGGQTNGVAILSGNNMEFQGQSAFFRNTGTTGPVILDVNNTTTFSGGFNFVTGAGTGTGVTIGGSGEVVISGNSSALVDTITLTDTVKLTLNNTIGGNLTVGPASTLAGNGTMGGSLSLLSGAKIVFSLTETLIVNGPSVTFGGFSIGDLIGLDDTVPNGTYTIIDGLATINTNNLINFGAANAYDLGGGKSAYFTVGSLEVNVVPEPSTYALLSLAASGLGAHLIRRRRR